MNHVRMTARSLATIVLLAVCGAAIAEEDRVESLQQPAWVTSEGTRSAAFPGQRLGSSDQVSTGEQGKIWLRLSEGSRVKLGNDASLKLDVQGMREQAGSSAAASGEQESEGFYEAALDVLKGAFRFTTTELGKRFQRDVEIQAGPVATIGIRGTDVWGRAEQDSSFVALIEGNISITRKDSIELTLDKPLTVFQASTDNPQGGTQQVAMADVQKLAPETELDTGEGILVEDGPYSVHLISVQDRQAAGRAEQSLKEQGYAASLDNVVVAGKTWYRVSIDGFATLADAESFREQAVSRGLADSPWVANNRQG